MVYYFPRGIDVIGLFFLHFFPGDVFADGSCSSDGHGARSGIWATVARDPIRAETGSFSFRGPSKIGEVVLPWFLFKQATRNLLVSKGVYHWERIGRWMLISMMAATAPKP